MPSLHGPRAKVNRANSHIVALHAAFHRFFKRHPYRVVVAEFDKQANHHNLRVQSGPSTFPDAWGLLIGEIAHNLRSALDGLTWQLALLTTPKPYDFTAFPICRVGRGKRRRKGSHRFHRQFWAKDVAPRLLQSLNRPFWTRIEGFQPYKKGNGGRLSPLFLLEELNNTDKHRLITVVTVVAGGIQLTGLWGAGGKLKTGVALNLNAKVGHVPPLPAQGVRVLDVVNGQVVTVNGRLRTRTKHEVQVDAEITPAVCFGDTCDAVKGSPVIRTLKVMADETSRVIESFAGEF